MPSLGNLWYTLGIDSKQLDADFKKINDKLKNAGSDLLINPKLAKSINEILPKGIKLELDLLYFVPELYSQEHAIILVSFRFNHLLF